MAVQILQGNALDARADALVLTIDGARRGMEGNIARAFARRWPDAFEEIEEQIRYPIPLGRTVATHPESDCPFRTVLFASTLHHLDVLTDTQKSAIIASALTEAVNLALKHRCRSVATAVMSGGWRLALRYCVERHAKRAGAACISQDPACRSDLRADPARLGQGEGNHGPNANGGVRHDPAPFRERPPGRLGKT
jgi:O-acetyl-ADP-ribose deacetylase (regulator of RNase III)